jgi:ribulose-phosphate 3-epimerase
MFDPESSSGAEQVASEISASLMCARLLRLGAELAELKSAGIDSIHLDLMDGHLVPNLGFSLDLVAAVCAETSLPVDAHLMVERPQMYVGELAKAGVRRCFFHVEAAEPTLAAEIIDAGMVPGAAISPGTPVEVLGGFDVPSVLVLSVPPGFAGQRWATGTEGRVASVPAISGKSTVVGVDGNVNGTHARAAAAAGATLFVAGTASIFSRRGSYRDLTSDLRSHVVAGRCQ